MILLNANTLEIVYHNDCLKELLNLEELNLD